MCLIKSRMCVPVGVPAHGALCFVYCCIQVHYHGTLIDGSVFDSSVTRGDPVSFPLDGVIKGWTEGLQLMRVSEMNCCRRSEGNATQARL